MTGMELHLLVKEKLDGTSLVASHYELFESKPYIHALNGIAFTSLLIIFAVLNVLNVTFYLGSFKNSFVLGLPNNKLKTFTVNCEM